MRIVAGSARGRRIKTPEGDHTRPTTDRVRESMFNALFSLGAIDEAIVVDLFAGSGALGLEALSRGAAHVTFVESSRRAASVIAENVAALGFDDQATVATMDVVGWLGRAASAASEPADLMLCDPPYGFEGWEDVLRIARAKIFVIESDREVVVPPRWSVLRNKRYGGTIVSILEAAAEDDPDVFAQDEAFPAESNSDQGSAHE